MLIKANNCWIFKAEDRYSISLLFIFLLLLSVDFSRDMCYTIIGYVWKNEELELIEWHCPL